MIEGGELTVEVEVPVRQTDVVEPDLRGDRANKADDEQRAEENERLETICRILKRRSMIVEVDSSLVALLVCW